MKIVLTGSTGNISAPLARQLVEAGHEVRLITRDREKQPAIEAMGAAAAIGSITDVPFLTGAFSGADAVYCMTPPNFAHPNQVAYYTDTARCYAEALQASGVGRAVYLSSYGAHLPSGTGFITGSYRAEQALNAVSLAALTHIRPGFFYYNLFGFIQQIRTTGCIGAVYGGEDRLALVSPLDIADALAEELTGPCTEGTRIRYVYSDDRTCTDVARVLGRAIGKEELEWKTLPAEEVLAQLKAQGIPANAAENLVELGSAIHSGALRSHFNTNRPAPGRVRLEDFAPVFAAAYQQQG